MQNRARHGADRAYVETICAQIEVPLSLVRRDARGRIVTSKRLIERLGDDDVLPDVCLWAFVWWATFNERVPTWGVTAMRALWKHGGGAIRERFAAGEIASAKRRILGRLSS